MEVGHWNALRHLWKEWSTLKYKHYKADNHKVTHTTSLTNKYLYETTSKAKYYHPCSFYYDKRIMASEQSQFRYYIYYKQSTKIHLSRKWQ